MNHRFCLKRVIANDQLIRNCVGSYEQPMQNNKLSPQPGKKLLDQLFQDANT